MNSQFRAELPALSYQRTHSLLIYALADLSYWQAAKNQHRTGAIALKQSSNQWTVTASADLVGAIIPF